MMLDIGSDVIKTAKYPNPKSFTMTAITLNQILTLTCKEKQHRVSSHHQLLVDVLSSIFIQDDGW